MNDVSDKFSGDMSRNEVEIDLSKFMSMVSEIGELKQKFTIVIVTHNKKLADMADRKLSLVDGKWVK